MACQAIKENATVCRNYAMSGEKFCHSHRNITKEVMTLRWRREYLYSGGKGFFYGNKDKTGKNVLAPLQNGHVVLTKTDIELIPIRSRYIDIYALLMEGGFCDPLWNMRMFYRTLKYYLQIEQYDIRNYILKEKVFANVLTKDAGSLRLSIGFMIILANDPIYSGKLVLFPLMMRLLDTSAGADYSWSAPDEKELLEVIETKYGENTIFMNFMRSRFLPEIREIRRTEKGIQRAKMDHVKEELMQFCWHPDRVEKYLEMGYDMGDDV